MSFDFSKFKIPGLFSQKNEPVVEVNSASDQEDRISYRRFGFIQAGMMKGKTEGLKICLHQVYEQHIAEMGRDKAKQEDLRKPYKTKLVELMTIGEDLKTQINTYEKEVIPAKKTRIEDLKKEISEIRRHPENYTGAHVGNVTFYIGTFILVLLSIYLFVFYSSASYSAFFKSFAPDDAVITKAIFDANAIGNAYRDGVTELIFLITIPFVFIGLGYLIHKFQELKNNSKYLKIAALLILTFIFDSIIAYEITEKIYDIKKGNLLEGSLPDYSFKLAFSTVGFWLIIFAGFIVYLIWGFVFDFVMDAHSKLDIVKVHIRAKAEQIAATEKEITEYENKVTQLKIDQGKNNGEMSKAKAIIDGTIIKPQAIKEALSQFMVGWYSWLSEGREYNRSEHNKIYEEFLSCNVGVIESFVTSN